MKIMNSMSYFGCGEWRDWCSTTETDKLSLVSVDDFMANAPAELRTVTAAEDPHKFFMNRLTHELELRRKYADGGGREGRRK